MEGDTNGGSALAVVVEEIVKLHGAEILDLDGGSAGIVKVALLPEGKTLEAVEAFFEPFRPNPIRRKGTAKIRDVASFVAHVKTFKDADSAVFLVDDPRAPRMLAVYDYNLKGAIGDVKPRFGTHRAEYRPELSDQWKAWTQQEGKAMAQGDFAAFVEDRIGDVILIDGDHINEVAQLLEAKVGGPSSLLKLSRGLQVSVNQTVVNAVTLSTGEVQVQFAETHTEAGAPITTPNLFFAAIPVFHGGEAYQVPIRLRYRLREGKLVWSYNIYRADKIFDDAFKGLRDTVTTECEVSVYAGEPEV